jgi:ABC-type phosphate/phosphonate transport system permease subunit
VFLKPSARRIDEIKNVEKKTKIDALVRRSLLIMRGVPLVFLDLPAVWMQKLGQSSFSVAIFPYKKSVMYRNEQGPFMG